MSGEVPIIMDMPMEGLFDGADIATKAMTFASTATQGAPTKAPIPPPKPLPIWDYFGAVIANLGLVGYCPTQDVSPFPFVLEFLTLYIGWKSPAHTPLSIP